MTQRRHIRQGDVLVLEILQLPTQAGAPCPEELPNRTILAHGEATGHHHSFPGTAAKLFMHDPDRLTSYVHVLEPTALTHQEHSPIEFRPGTYEVRRQRQWTLERRVRHVVD